MVTKMVELGTEQSGDIAITTVDPMELTPVSHVRETLRGPILGRGMGTTRSNLMGWGQRCPQDLGTKMAELGTEQSGGIVITTVDPMEVALLSHMRGHWRGPTLGHGMGTTRSNLMGWGQRCPQDLGTSTVTKMAGLSTEHSADISITTIDPMEVALLSHVRGTLERSNFGPWDGDNQVQPHGMGTTVSPRSGDMDGDQDGGAGHGAESWHRHPQHRCQQ